MTLSLSGTRWVLKEADPGLVASLSTELQVSPSVARCLAVRGVTSPEQGRLLLHPTSEAFHDPFAMHGMTEAVARLQRALANNESIRAVTDYDVDGTTSSLILQGVLRLLGAKRLSYHIPDRMDEGYGFSVRAAEQAAADGVSLILTADIGVKDHASVTRARELGVDVIVCDHHLPPDADVPQDAAVVLCPPQRSCSYPNPHLAACGVSFKLAQALLADHPKRDAILRSLLKLVAIGTVADVVDLRTPENRAIVSLGLDSLNEGPHKPGLAALLQASGLTPGEVTSTDLGFRIGPRINAAGRMASATAVVELLSTTDPARAQSLARDLERMNQERRRVQDQVQDQAMAQVTEPAPPMILVHGSEQSGWHRGVTGIVAARIRDRFHRPCAVVAIHGEEAVASVRSTPEVHAVHMLDAASDLLLRYGGHPAAAGFSVRTEHIEALTQRLSAAALEQTGGTIPTPTRSADLQLDPSQVDRGLLDSLARLAPHGKGNPSPRIWIAPTQVQNVRVLKEKHLKLRVGGPGAGLDVLWWGAVEHEELLRSRPQVELLGSLSLNKWRGRETLQMTLDDVRVADQSTHAH